MSKIIGEPNALKRIQNAVPGDKTMYVNMDAIRDLPDEFEVVVSEITFDVSRDFSNVGSNDKPAYMPNPELGYRIAEAKGISGGEILESASVYEEVDINPMLCKPMDAEPTYRKMKVGHSVTKYSTVLEEDGTVRKSSPRQSFFNVWERCLELWSKEESYTDGYRTQGKYPPKYNTPHKRRAHYDAEMKFAQAKADSKAHLKTIRELAGLPTGFSPADLASGSFVFSKVRRSKEILKLESAARVDALRHGIAQPAPTALLFGTTSQEPEPAEPEPEFPIEPEPEFEVIVDKRQELISVLKAYDIPEAKKKTVHDLIAWLERTPDAEQNERFWPNALRVLADVEKTIPEEARIRHSLGGQA